MTKTRIKVLYYYTFHNRNNVTLPELIKFFFDLSYRAKAQKFVEVIETENNWNKIYLSGLKNKPLYFPSEFNLASLEQVIVESFYENNWHYYEIEQTKVKANDIVVDCGAAEGLFSLLVTDRCKYVYAVEPLKKFVESLSLTFKNTTNVKIVDKALSDHEYISFISEQGISSVVSDDKEGIEINVTTLDKLFFENNIPVSYIKMDLEGFDYLALKGAAKLIKKNNPKIAVTTYHDCNHSKQISELILEINPNYKILTKGIFQETGSPVMLHAWV